MVFMQIAPGMYVVLRVYFRASKLGAFISQVTFAINGPFKFNLDNV